MADVVAIADALLRNPIPPVTDKGNLELDLMNVRQFTKKIISILADVENMEVGSSPLRIWFRELAVVASDAEVVLDGLNNEYLRRMGKFRKWPLLFVDPERDTYFHKQAASRIREINTSFNRIFRESGMIGVNSDEELLPSTTIVSQQTSSFIDGVNYVVGREDDKREILNKIFTSNDEGEVISVLPIVGMGGVGKTIMAQLIYSSQEIQEHFDQRIWISVPGSGFSKMEIFSLILEKSTGTKARSLPSWDLVVEFRRMISLNKYFLVLDNVWCDDSNLWDGIFSEFREFSKGKNWCLVTTRSAKVAQAVSQGPAYSLTLLSDNECWRIIQDECRDGKVHDQELLPIKTQLVTSCGGLPLAAKVVANFLRSLSEKDWPEIVSRLLKDEGGNGILQSLRRSYEILPHPIKKCFAFFSVFDVDNVIEKDLVIELWMAQGFLDHGQGVRMEETGVGYFNTLVQVSLLQEIRGGRFYLLHPCVRNLALSVSKLQHISSKDLTSLAFDVRHLAFGASGETVMYTDASAFIFHGSSNYEEQLLEFKYLCALNLSKVDMTDLPSSIGALGLLRFLNLSSSKITSLPETLCDLYQLETLRMVDCLHLLGFPKKMSGLDRLRHLHYFNDDEKFQMPVFIRRLRSLQTLEFFNVGDTEGCRIEELGDLNDLKGKLVIRNLELVKSAEGARKASLSTKSDLMKLDLQWGSVDRENDTHTLEGLEPHRNLQKLVIRNFWGSSFPQWLGNMEMLVKLKLVGCERCRELPALGHLPYLEHVELRGLGEVRYLGHKFYGLDYSVHGSNFLFPALKTLTIINLSSLTKWIEDGVSDNGMVFPKLENLTIRDCFKLTTIPTIFPNLKYLELSRCHSVTHISDSETPLEIVRLLDCKSLLEFPVIFRKKFLRWLEIRECPEIREVFLGCGQENLEVIISDCKRLEIVQWQTMEHCAFLRGLKVYDCPNLRHFNIDFKGTPHLFTLWLYRCPQLLIDELHHLTNLSELRIGSFSYNPYLFSYIFDMLTLRVLRLYGFHTYSVREVPFGPVLGCSTSLTELWLQDFGSLEALPEWIGNLTSLETLGLSNCRNLRQLPSLHAMTRLTKLQILDVYECPLLKERCSDPEGSEWLKISHIPNIWIL